MKIRMGFVSNSSSTGFIIAYKWDRFDDNMVERASQIANYIDIQLKTKNLQYKNTNGDSYHKTVGQMLFAEADHYIGYRSLQSALDDWNFKNIDDIQDEGSLEYKAAELIKQGYIIIMDEILHDGDGGSELSNIVAHDKDKYQIDTDSVKVFFD